ncbi:transferrin-a isoform X2 [Anguilla anguilla]|uniref:transferrin-a isoform X2 n=1 Tax=Anguilla anguilla TaxID=7936 RepID=UPI0015ACB17C|nr:transferrin-a isoform X2 [Anguilla anguilla]
MKAVVSLLLIGCLASALAAPPVKWCAQSEAEKKKCDDLAGKNELKDLLTCVQKEGADGCIKAIKARDADAVTLDGGDIYHAGLENYDLHPIIAEDYGPGSDTCYYAVAVAKVGTNFGFNDLNRKKSCHTGLGKSAGWKIPIGTLLAQNRISWGGIDDESLVKAVSEFFSESCVPGADQDMHAKKYNNLCSLCGNDCSRTHKNPYYDYSGAFKCLVERGGDVAFVKHTTVPDSEKSKYELLCKDGTRKSVNDFATCYLARVPAHAVVSRKDADLTERIWQMLQTAMKFSLFSSTNYKAKDLLFKDSTVKLVQIPKSTESFLYLGAEYMSIVRSLQKAGTDMKRDAKEVKWCAVGLEETKKCDNWGSSIDADSGKDKISCATAPTVDNCIKKIMRKEADAMTLDGGELYTAGLCGLVPVMAEQYDEAKCSNSGDTPASSYYAVAVAKKGTGFSWADLRGKKSCHTGMGRTAGWNVPMGLIHKDTNDCEFSSFFSESCAPGADEGSSLCKLCVGKGKDNVGGVKCRASTEELYFGYAGAFRCLVEGGGDVAFVKHTTVPDSEKSKYKLLCKDGTRKSVNDFATCHLAKVPAHAVVSRKDADLANRIWQMLQTAMKFSLFSSTDYKAKDLLFKDSTVKLVQIPKSTESFLYLGAEYMSIVRSLQKAGTDMKRDAKKVKWCAVGQEETKKCDSWSSSIDPDSGKDQISCATAPTVDDCIKKIMRKEADAMTLDGGELYTAGLCGLVPVMAEQYDEAKCSNSGDTPASSYYAVAVVKNGTGFSWADLRGKKSCHTGMGRTAGWNVPMGLIHKDTNDCEFSSFFSESCAPGADEGSSLCKLCVGKGKDKVGGVKCRASTEELYFGYAGAFRCLVEGGGDVAFVEHTTVPDSEKSKYELLCKDGTRKSVNDFATCYLARVPAHAVVSRKDADLAERIWQMLQTAMKFSLFSSTNYKAKDLLFKDSTVKLVQIPKSTDSFLYLGAEYMSIVRSLQKAGTDMKRDAKEVKWCAVGHEEIKKCDSWSSSIDPDSGKDQISCANAPTVDDCIKKIMRKEADAMALDGGTLYTAGMCGLVPVMAEQYDEAKCSNSGDTPTSSYYAVAVVKKGTGFSWADLRGKKSCHTGMGRTAGWNVPMGLIRRDTNDCEFSSFFSESCAPGADEGSSLCKLCKGKYNRGGVKCRANTEELYYGNSGAFRCLAEVGDVAFVKHKTVGENSDGNGPSWASALKSADFELLCLDNTRAPVSDYVKCHLAKVPAHAVVTRPEMRDQVVAVLKDQESLFGINGFNTGLFKMFQSEGSNLLFEDSTKCLQEVIKGQSFKDFLGKEYYDAVTSLKTCSTSVSGPTELEKACTFHTCQQKA